MGCSLPDPFSSPGKNTGVVSHLLFQGISQTQGLNLSFLHYRQILYLLSYQRSPIFIPDQYHWILFWPLWSHLCYDPALWFFSWILSLTCFLVTCLFLNWRGYWQSLETYPKKKWKKKKKYPASAAVVTQFWHWNSYQYKIWRRHRIMVILCDKEWQHKQSISTFQYNSVPLSMVSIFFQFQLSTLNYSLLWP